MREDMKKIPMSACGLALGLAALGNLLMPYSMIVRYVCGGLSLLLLLWLTMRLILDFAGAKEEMENPVVLSVMPTYTMAWMLLAGYLVQINSAYWKASLVGIIAAQAIWYIALFLQGVIIVVFVVRFVFSFSVKTVFPSWFIIFVGFVVATVTAPAMQAVTLGKVLFYIGFVLYLLSLPVVLYRMSKVKPIPPPARPVTAIFCAPVGLLLTGYCTVFEQRRIVFYLVLTLTVVSYLFVLTRLPKLLKSEFYPSYSAFTFPLVICAIGFVKAGAFFEQGPAALVWKTLAIVATIIATLAVLYVLVRYCMFLFGSKPKDQAGLIIEEI